MSVVLECRTCKHFTPGDGWVDNASVAHFGPQRLQPFSPLPWGGCERIPDQCADSLEDRAVVVDLEGYSASLKVRSDFGCVLWEPGP